MKLTREKAQQIAIDFVNKDRSNHFYLALTNVEVSRISHKYWSATFEVITSEGHVMEGPLLILVDDDLEKAMTLDEAIEAHLLE
ncbi:hypothetical protein [Paenibacillus lemnae]|uniref:Uncharacterized protein n=1 Tax=Paenibacillus lemnae TaxID=1330551 RepID=A0A848M5C5_PAELE|nr:hypothetical protein [Paenibacillus lemnae]NMO95003.1 hypothetical protein [Paenibacillus lemnae]